MRPRRLRLDVMRAPSSATAHTTAPLPTHSCARCRAHHHRPQRCYGSRRKDQGRPAGRFETIPALGPRPAPKGFHVGAGCDSYGIKLRLSPTPPRPRWLVFFAGAQARWLIPDRGESHGCDS